MTFFKNTLISLVILTFVFVSQAKADLKTVGPNCKSLLSNSLVSNLVSILAVASSGQIQPKCEEVQLSKTCTATYYGKGDGFSGGKTACGDRFQPLREKTVAIKTANNGGFFDKSLCGKKAFVTAKDPTSGVTRTIEVRITDSGSMGGTTSRRCMDLSYRAASELGIVNRGVASNTTIKVCK